MPQSIDPEALFFHWFRSIDRFQEVYVATRSVPNVTWNLDSSVDAISCAYELRTQVERAKTRIDAALESYTNCFKIGITHLPAERFLNPEWGYAADGYHELRILITSPSAPFIARCERALLDHYRRYDTRNQCINIHGHPLCHNKLPGGESSSHGTAPFNCYVAIKRNPRLQFSLQSPPCPCAADEVDDETADEALGLA